MVENQTTRTSGLIFAAGENVKAIRIMLVILVLTIPFVGSGCGQTRLKDAGSGKSRDSERFISVNEDCLRTGRMALAKTKEAKQRNETDRAERRQALREEKREKMGRKIKSSFQERI